MLIPKRRAQATPMLGNAMPMLDPDGHGDSDRSVALLWPIAMPPRGPKASAVGQGRLPLRTNLQIRIVPQMAQQRGLFINLGVV